MSDRTLADRYEVSRSTIWHWARTGKLPRPVKISSNTTRWDDDQVNEFMAGLYSG
ncbi:MAG: AlpA family phage regulatory protein [Gammaproteobacteria bacterium]|nr:AlpA family phage regulatory protein [Gammaproteobacteria bacterium]MDP6733794.1 AlpA family phage regulatory protein [Gammaproteobacteria bacterium]